MGKLHDAYKELCQERKRNSFSITKFSEYFNDNNFSLFRRKKDISAHDNTANNVNVTIWQVNFIAAVKQGLLKA